MNSPADSENTDCGETPERLRLLLKTAKEKH